MRKLSYIAALLLIAVAARADSQAEKYFPLTEGREWVYTVTVFNASNQEIAKEKLFVKNLPSTELEGKKVTPQILEKKTKQIHYYHADDRGISSIGVKQNDELTSFVVPLYMIILPLKVGSTLKEADAELRIESDKETLTVMAGTFNNCIKIKTVQNNGMEILAWFAEGVGRLQSIMKRPDGAKAIIQLESYK